MYYQSISTALNWQPVSNGTSKNIMKKNTFSRIFIISLLSSVLTLCLLLFLTKMHILFITENNISDDLLLYFQNFLIYGLLLDPIGWIVLTYLIVQFHKRNHDIQKTMIFAFIQKETKNDLKLYWLIDLISLIFSYNILDNVYITIMAEFFVLIMTHFLTFHSILFYLVKKNHLY